MAVECGNCISHLSEYRIPHMFFSSSKLLADISQIACPLEMQPVTAVWGRKHDNLWKFK